MTSSSDRLDRIEALVESTAKAIDRNAEAIDRNAEAIDNLTGDIGRFNDRLDTYEKGMRWVVQLAFALLISATVALIVNATAFLVRLLLPYVA
jgi:cell division protein FtsX